MSTYNMLFAGFGGQGILFAGRLAAYAGFLAGREVTWLPSYGAESRGGTSNCAVRISDALIGSPLVPHPDFLMVMNLPSLDKFEASVVPGGMIFADETLVARKAEREDVRSVYIPATAIASGNNFPKLANVVLFGRLMRETGLFTPEQVEAAIVKCVPASKSELIELNKKAFYLGYE